MWRREVWYMHIWHDYNSSVRPLTYKSACVSTSVCSINFVPSCDMISELVLLWLFVVTSVYNSRVEQPIRNKRPYDGLSCDDVIELFDLCDQAFSGINRKGSMFTGMWKKMGFCRNSVDFANDNSAFVIIRGVKLKNIFLFASSYLSVWRLTDMPSIYLQQENRWKDLHKISYPSVSFKCIILIQFGLKF